MDKIPEVTQLLSRGREEWGLNPGQRIKDPTFLNQGLLVLC